MAPGFLIDNSYQEDLTLRDRTRIRLRAIRASDKRRLAEGLAKLSVESQHGRFFSPKSHFTDEELHYLTELDAVDHFAVGAVQVGPRRKEGAGLGISRFVRLPDEPEVAEAAVAVIDEMQTRGIGRLLLELLQRELRAQEDPADGVVDLMGDASGQGPDRGEALPPLELDHRGGERLGS